MDTDLRRYDEWSVILRIKKEYITQWAPIAIGVTVLVCVGFYYFDCGAIWIICTITQWIPTCVGMTCTILCCIRILLVCRYTGHAILD